MRTAGATSCVQVTLAQLNEVLQPSATVLISRRQANMLGLIGKAEFASNETLKAAGNQPAIAEIPDIPVAEID